MESLSVVILTKNEEKNIERCLKSVVFCDEVIIVDDNSTDKTLELAKKLSKKSKIFQRALNNDFAAQRNFGLSKATGDWVLFIDADEEVSKELQDEMVSLRQPRRLTEAYYINRRDFFWGKELKYGETKTVREKGIIRLVKRNSGKWLGDVHEVYHTAKNIDHLKSFINHYPHQTLKEFIEKINFYSTLRARELFNKGKSVSVMEIIFVPFFKFLYNYFLLLGFLDGPAGFTYAFMMTFHSFLVRSKLYQYWNLKNDD